MNNYVYIIAGLPELTLNYEDNGFSYEKVKDYFLSQLSERDKSYVELLENGFDDNKLNADFYKKTSESKNRFLKEYFLFDLHSRNMKVSYLAKRLGQDPNKHIIDATTSDFEEQKQVQAILDKNDIVAREQEMDELRWKIASEITRMEYFSMDVILAFLLKAKIVERWSKLDADKGQEMFKKLIQEIRGTSADLDLSGGEKH